MDYRLHYLVAMVALTCLATMASGMTFAFPAVVIPAVTEQDSEKFNSTQVSLVGVIYYLTIISFSLLASPISKVCGRRKSFLISISTVAAGWLLTASNDSIIVMVVGININGAGMGLTSYCTTVYLSKIFVKGRKAILFVRNSSFFLGITLTYILGYWLRNDWRYIAFVSSSLPLLVFVVGLFYLSEPPDLLSKRSSRERKDDPFFVRCQNLWSALLNRPEVYRPFYIHNSLSILRELSGMAALITNTIMFIKKVTVGTNPYLLAIVLGLSSELGCLFAALLPARYGRRRTLVYVGTLTSLSLLILAKLQRISGMQIEEWPLFTAEGILFVIIGTSTVFLLVSQNMPDMYPPEFREMCCSIGNFNGALASGVAAVTFPVLSKCLSYNSLLMIYATSNVFCVILVIVAVPDVGKMTGKTEKHISDKIQPGVNSSADVHPLQRYHEPVQSQIGNEELNPNAATGIKNIWEEEQSKMCSTLVTN